MDHLGQWATCSLFNNIKWLMKDMWLKIWSDHIFTFLEQNWWYYSSFHYGLVILWNRSWESKHIVFSSIAMAWGMLCSASVQYSTAVMDCVCGVVFSSFYGAAHHPAPFHLCWVTVQMSEMNETSMVKCSCCLGPVLP